MIELRRVAKEEALMDGQRLDHRQPFVMLGGQHGEPPDPARQLDLGDRLQHLRELGLDLMLEHEAEAAPHFGGELVDQALPAGGGGLVQSLRGHAAEQGRAMLREGRAQARKGGFQAVAHRGGGYRGELRGREYLYIHCR